MNFSRILATITIAFAISAGSALAQKKPPVKRPAPRPTPSTYASPLELRTAREKVSNQVANVTRFTDVLGPIAASVEGIDRESRTRRVSESSLKQNEANKAKVRQAIQNLRAGLVKLETEFRTKPGLRKFLPKIDGITVLSAESEDLAFAGKFTESRRPLLTVLQKLSDTLAVIR